MQSEIENQQQDENIDNGQVIEDQWIVVGKHSPILLLLAPFSCFTKTTRSDKLQDQGINVSDINKLKNEVFALSH